MERREVIKNLSVLPVTGVLGNSSLQKVIDSKDTNTMEGEAILCEYGTAFWKAKRHIYR